MRLKLINCHHIKKWRRRRRRPAPHKAPSEKCRLKEEPVVGLHDSLQVVKQVISGARAESGSKATTSRKISSQAERSRCKQKRSRKQLNFGQLLSLSLMCLIIVSDFQQQIASKCAQLIKEDEEKLVILTDVSSQKKVLSKENSTKLNDYNGILKQTLSWLPMRKELAKSRQLFVLVEAIPDANRLYEDLMMTYNRIVRPVQNNSDRVVVKLSLKLSQLIDVNLKNQMMTTNVWLNQHPERKYYFYTCRRGYQNSDTSETIIISKANSQWASLSEWSDYKLKWDPSEYGGIEDINVPAEQIWLPDIVLYNSAEGYFAVSIMTKAKVRYDGYVTWNPPAIFRSSCQIDITYFPFDSQNCHLKFGSWTFGTKIDLRHIHINDTEQIERGTDLSEYYQNVEWDIMKASAKRNVITYTCCPNDFYPDVTFNFTLRRKPLFYTVNLILPCIGITILSFLVFYLPSDSGEKVTLTISILVSLIFFLSVLIETIPSTSLAMPLLGKYLAFTMILITLSVCATVFVLNIHFRTPSTHSMPLWVKHWCIDILPKYLFMNVPQYQSSQTNILPEQLIYPHNPAYATKSCPNTLETSLQTKHSNSQNKIKANHDNNNTTNIKTIDSGGHQKQQLQLNASNLMPNMMEADKLCINSSSLFLPYLQSEAARRLQMQRSRSSERDTRSTSEAQPPAKNNNCDTNNRQQRTTNVNIDMGNNNKQENSLSSSRRRSSSLSKSSSKKQSLSPAIWRLFSKKSQVAAAQDNIEMKDERRFSSKSNSDQEDENSEYDYEHHNHFQVRASICSTNMWRIGPTRRCSIAVPANYPTYYKPLTLAPNMHQVSTISGCHQADHYHTGSLAEDSLSSCGRDGAVGALVTAAATNLTVRPKEPPPHMMEQRSSTLRHQQELKPLSGLMCGSNVNSRQQTPHLNLSMATPPPPLPPPAHFHTNQNLQGHFRVQHQPYESQQTFNQKMLAHPVTRTPRLQQQQPSQDSTGIRSRVNVQCPTLNLLSTTSRSPTSIASANQMLNQSPMNVYCNNNLPPNVNLHYQTLVMPRSRSTDHRLCGYARDLTSQPQSNYLTPNSLTGNQQPLFNQQEQRPDNRQPQIYSVQQPIVNNHNYLLHNQHSIGRALGQAYMQRLQRQSTVYSIQPNSSDTQQTVSRSNQHGSSTYLLPLLNSSGGQQTSLCQDVPNNLADSLRRCRSQTSLNRRPNVLNCEQCLRKPDNRSWYNDQMANSCHCNLDNRTSQLNNQLPTSVPLGTLIQQPRQACCNQRTTLVKNGQNRCLNPQNCLNFCKKVHQQQQQQLFGANNNQNQPSISAAGLLRLITDVDKAIQNAMFIAQHIDNLDEFESVKENWKYIAMVIDRIFLIVFLFACVVGTVTIFGMVPWSNYTTDQPIDLQLTRLMALNLTEDQPYSRSCQEF